MTMTQSCEYVESTLKITLRYLISQFARKKYDVHQNECKGKLRKLPTINHISAPIFKACCSTFPLHCI